MSRNFKSEPALRAQLEKGLEELGLECSAHQVEQLLDYVSLLVTWNSAYNLTAIREPERDDCTAYSWIVWLFSPT